jgi:hypothetical protein
MIVIWKADYDGEDIQTDLYKMDEIQSMIIEKIGGKVEGPYFPQDASILYIYHLDKYEKLNEGGRIWFSEVGKAKIPFTPKTYEIAVTPKEFFG